MSKPVVGKKPITVSYQRHVIGQQRLLWSDIITIIINVLLYTSKRLPFLLTGLWDVHATHCTRTCSRRSLSITSYGCCGTGWSSSIRQSYFTTGYVNFRAVVHKFNRRRCVCVCFGGGELSNKIPTGYCSNRAHNNNIFPPFHLRIENIMLSRLRSHIITTAYAIYVSYCAVL